MMLQCGMLNCVMLCATSQNLWKYIEKHMEVAKQAIISDPTILVALPASLILSSFST